MALLTNPLRRATARATAPRGRRAPIASRVLTVAGWAVLIAVVALMWPSALGGHSTIVRVAGDSMAPTYMTRDLLLARHHDGGYAVGDVVVFDVPDGAGAGMRVVHRITRVSETFEGTSYSTRGDNRTTDDQWAVTDGDVMGKVVYHLSGSGAVMAKLSDPAAIAVIGIVVIVLLLLPSRRSRAASREGTAECSEKCSDACPGTDDEPTATATAPSTVDVSDDSADGSSDYVVREAEASTSPDRAR